MYAIGSYDARTMTLQGYIRGAADTAQSFATLAQAERVAHDMNAAGHWPDRVFAPCAATGEFD